MTILHNPFRSTQLKNVELARDPLARRLTTDITNGNVQSAVDLWLSNPSTAQATYGPIAAWNTASVTDMSQCKRPSSFARSFPLQ
jgi:hypothetical protein